MDYFQYKAQQMLLLDKENHEWQEFCKRVAPECAACAAEATNTAESRDIGVQASSKNLLPVTETRKVTFESKQSNGQLPETLKNVTRTLERIDFTLSKMYDVSSRDEKIKSKAVSSSNTEKSLGSFAEQRKLLIQNSLKASIKKLENSPSLAFKKPTTTIKYKDFGYLIPRELQVKRAAARKAYLASLETKPKISFQNTKKNVQIGQNKKVVEKKNFKSKKNVTKPANQASDICKEEVQTAVSETNEIVGGETSASIISPSALQTAPKLTVNDSSHIKDLKLFHNTSEKSQQESGDLKKILVDTSTNTFPTESGSTVQKANSNSVQCETSFEIRTQLKFVCEGSQKLTIDQQTVKNITQNKDNFFKYLEKISRRVKGNFNPWILNEMLAETLLDECIKEVGNELNETCYSIVRDTFNKEFVQVIE